MLFQKQQADQLAVSLWESYLVESNFQVQLLKSFQIQKKNVSNALFLIINTQKRKRSGEQELKVKTFGRTGMKGENVRENKNLDRSPKRKILFLT